MGCDVKKGWCRCGQFHQGKIRKKRASKVKKPPSEAADPPETEKPEKPDEPQWKYPFGAPRIW